MDTDLDPIQWTTWVFSGPSNLDPPKSCLWTLTQSVTPLSCDLEPDITKPNSGKIFVSADMAHDLSAGIDSVWVISWVFRDTFILNSSYHDFEKSNEGRKMSSQLWLRMAGHLNYILSIYEFSSSSYVSLKKYTGHNLKNLMWLSMAGEFMSIYFYGYGYLSNL